MNWVSIDEGLCNQCGLCVTRCMTCFSERDGVIAVQADAATCIACGHCVSVCPTGAIRHRKMDMDNFPPIDDLVSFDTHEFFEFLRQRRSHRHFTNKKIPRSHLETLIDACRYAPTGGNRQPVKIKILEVPERIALLSSLSVDHFMGMIERVEGRIAKLQAAGERIPEDLSSLQMSLARYKAMGIARETGMDMIFRGAPCVMIFHASPREAVTPKDDCVIAAHTVSLLARTMKLETCYIGLFVTAANAHPPIGEALQLPLHHKVYSVLIVGYPKLKYLRAVDRRPIEVTWE